MRRRVSGRRTPRVGISAAQAADVTSANIVGFTKVNLVQGWNLLGVQFQDVGSAQHTRALSTVGILDAGYAGYDDDYKFSNILRPWDAQAQGYDFYGWAGTSGTEVDDDPTLDNTWTDLDAEAVNVNFKNGDGFWVKAEKAGTITLQGEVNTNSVTFSLVAGWNLVANPYPIDVPITNFGVLDAGQPGYDDDYKFPCILRPWDAQAQGYDFYGWAGTSGTEVDDDPSLDNTWTDLDAEATDAVIHVGESAWIKVPTAGTITFTYPVNN